MANSTKAATYLLAFIAFMGGGIYLCGLALPYIRQDLFRIENQSMSLYWVKFSGGIVLVTVGALLIILSIGMVTGIFVSLFPHLSKRK
jgi:uncharacterized membrane protein